MTIAGVSSALPPHYYPQEVILDALSRYWSSRLDNPQFLTRLHHRTGVGGRYFVLPLERYYSVDTFGKSNNVWIEAAQDLGEKAIRCALQRARIDVQDIGAFFFVSVTGVASPSIDAKLINRMKLPVNTKRIPIFGLGCVAGAAGIARAADYVRAFPNQVAVLLSVELCSLTLQHDDLSIANLISSGLFGDGAAAVVVAGAEVPARNPEAQAPATHGVALNAAGEQGPLAHGSAAQSPSAHGPAVQGPKVLATRSTFYPGTDRVMGWDISERGFQIVLSREVPDVIVEHLGADLDGFLADQGLTRADIGSFIMHTGGPKVLEATEQALNLAPGALAPSWDCLHRVGNLSSASVLFVLEDAMMNRRPAPGTLSILAAMGPGFCSELVLLKW